MKKKALALTLISAMMFLSMVETQFVDLASGNFLPPPPELPYVYIRADGTVEPQTLPIQRVGDTYTFTGNIVNYTLAIQRDNVVIDGAGYTLQGNGTGKGIVMTNMTNVTVKRIVLRNLDTGVYCMQSLASNISENTIANCDIGIYLSSSQNNNVARNNIMKTASAIIAYASSNNIIVENQITENTGYGIALEAGYDYKPSNYCSIVRNNITSNVEQGIRVSSSSYCRIEENIIASSKIGIQFYGSACQQNNIINNTVVNHIWGIQMTAGPSFNNVTGNSIANNEYGIYIFNSNSSLFFHNNFINNRRHVSINLPVDVDDSPDSLVPSIPPSVNAWDNGREGNFWSNYTGKDTNGDGVGDIFYVIDDSNQDRFPLMKPITAPLISIPGLPEDGTSPTQSTEPFPTVPVVAVSVAAIVFVSVGLLVYFKKHKSKVG